MPGGVFDQRRVNCTPPRPSRLRRGPVANDPLGMHVKGVEVFPDSELRSNVGPTQFCWSTSVRCTRRQNYVV
jgi:hypothetical protein